MTSLPLATELQTDCWNDIGIRGDRSCSELTQFVHCHNCPVFASASQKFLDSLPPAGYLEEETLRLSPSVEHLAADLQSALVFRIAEEWLALNVQVLIEVTTRRAVHRIPRRDGLLAGLVNIRGELQLCVRLSQLIGHTPASPLPDAGTTAKRNEEESNNADRGRLLVVQSSSQRWVFPVDEVDQVHRFNSDELTTVPATVSRSRTHLTRGLFNRRERSIGYLDHDRLFDALRTRLLP